MRFSKLELSGFKSFAKPTSLEFPVPVSAIVGPNGSGKSNIAEAVRWVMGEQSMKSLRGRRGEDLIFNGSPKAPRMGKASVVLHFDNSDGRIPVDFPEVRIERRIFRDGTNEYILNDSTVRLKDIVELMAKIGLGETKHNIIGQGEVDRWLLSSARDRKEILEEALGLKVYQLKKDEAERKLGSTQENMRQAEALLRELAPHLKFLKHQAEKASAREHLEAELNKLERIYFAKLLSEIEREEAEIARGASPIEKELAAAENAIQHLKSKIQARESAITDAQNAKDLESRVVELEEALQKLERDSGRTEGRLLAEREKFAKPLLRIADAGYVKEKILKLLQFLRLPLQKPEELTWRFEKAVADLELLVGDIEKGSVKLEPDGASQEALLRLGREAEALERELGSTRLTLRESKAKLQERDQTLRNTETDLRKLERELREAEETRAKISSKLERATYERENLATRREEFKKELGLVRLSETHIREVKKDDIESVENTQELFKKIERLRGKLEEIGGIDASVIKEYQDAESRYAFLSKELEDLKSAVDSLEELIATLDKQIAYDFNVGFKKINDEFNHYFNIIFGGGKAKLIYEPIQRRGSSGEEAGEEAKEEVEYGIDIDVDIPRKRIKGLAMLSGGERALTSIALLFAMVLVSPPPFLVLDETDAALDEANSRKYANTLADLSQKSQLIIITHNRETMMRSGILYGVTMSDDGISKLLSIKLEEGEKYVNR